jgi:hypothetical protein
MDFMIELNLNNIYERLSETNLPAHLDENHVY